MRRATQVRSALRWNRLVAGLGLSAAVVLLLGFRQTPDTEAATALTAAQVVQKMVAMNAARTAALQAYSSIRDYHLVYHGLGHASADMKVKVTYRNPGPKTFTVLSESGSGMLRHHVLDPLLKTERNEAEIEAREGSAIAPQYYRFKLVSTPHGDQTDYILALTPIKKHAGRFVFRGKIWVNPVDFGIEQAEGASVTSLSWWVSHFSFSYRSRKVGDFWLPAANRCVSHVRLFGPAVLNITYGDFELTSIRPVSFVSAGLNP